MANPLTRGGYDLGNLPYSNRGAGAFLVNANEQNIQRKLEKLYQDYAVGGIKTGGNKEIWADLQKWNSRSTGQQSQLFSRFMRTGQWDDRLNPRYLLGGFDQAIRNRAHHMQNKGGFFDSILGKVVGIGATALGGLAGGPLGGALVGGAIGGASGGIKGGLLGALGGGLGAGTVGSLAGRFGIPSNFLNVPNPFGGGLGGLGGALGGTVNNLNQFFPADIAARAAAGAGGGMSAFGNLLSGVGNFLGSDLGGNLLGAGLNYFGSRQGMDQLNSAADRAFQSAQFQPYNVSGPLGGVAFNGNRINASLSPEGRRVANQLRGLVNTNLRGYNEFDPNNYAQNYYDTVSGLQAPELTAQTNSALSDIYNRGMWGSTEGARNIYNMDQSRMLADNALRLQAQQAGATESDRLFNNYMKSVATYNTQLGIPMGYINAGLNAGTGAANAGANANQYPWLAAQNQADASSAFWSSIASAAPSMMANLFNRGSGSQERNQYNYSRGFYNPSGLGIA